MHWRNLGMETERVIHELAVIHCLDEISGLGPIKFRRIFEANGSFSVFWERSEKRATDPSFQSLGFEAAFQKKFFKQLKMVKKKFKDSKAFIVEQLERAEKTNGKLLSYSDAEYPPNLYKTNQCVPILYAAGNLGILRNNHCVAVVGTRKPTEWSRGETIAAVKELAKQDYVIVSGLAVGIDTIAHETALACNAKTISVLGCGVDVYYPKENQKLQDEIRQRGVIVSEYPFGSRIQSISLQKRDKVIVGMSKHVLIVETSKTGGTMNAYRAAVEQKKLIGVFLPPMGMKKHFDGNVKIAEEGKIRVRRFSNGSTISFEGSIDDQRSPF
jgi:DNA processing protein